MPNLHHITGFRSRIINAIITRLRIQRPLPGHGINAQETAAGTILSCLPASAHEDPFIPVAMHCLNPDDEQPRDEPPTLTYDVYPYGKAPAHTPPDSYEPGDDVLLTSADPAAEPHQFKRDSYWPTLTHGHRGDAIKPSTVQAIDAPHSHGVDHKYHPPADLSPTRLWTHPATFGIALRVAEPHSKNEDGEDEARLIIVWCNEYISEIDDEDYDPENPPHEDEEELPECGHPGNNPVGGGLGDGDHPGDGYTTPGGGGSSTPDDENNEHPGDHPTPPCADDANVEG